MKKILTVLIMTLIMAGSLFAYEPKIECAKVKRNGNVSYYEKTELYNMYGFEPDKRDLYDWYSFTYDHVGWLIRKGYTVEQFVDHEYENFERLRDSYYNFMKKANQSEPSNASKAFTDAINAINGTNTTPEEHERKICLDLAERHKRTAIISIVFVTEENFLTLTKEEMLAKMYAFIEEVKAANKK